MHIRIHTLLIAILLCLIPTLTAAQSFFGFGGNSSNKSTHTPVTSTTSASDFQNSVNVINQQNRNAFLQEMNKPSQTAPRISTMPPVPAMPDNSAATPSLSPAPPAAVTPTTPAAPSTSISNSTPTIPGNIQPQSSQPPGQVYTGFGAGKDTNNTKPSSDNSGGWNIKY